MTQPSQHPDHGAGLVQQVVTDSLDGRLATEEWVKRRIARATENAGAVVTPTGTGFRHVTAGVEDAASKLVEHADVAPANLDGLAGVPSLRTLGTGSQQACAGDDSRLLLQFIDLVGDATGGGTGTFPVEVVQARGLRETSGPTTLVVGEIADGQFCRRVGSALIGATPAAGSATIAEAVVNAPYGSLEYSEVVVDASVSPASRIMVMWGACTDDDENSPMMDDVAFMAVAGSGEFTISMRCEQQFGGPFRLNYLVG